MNLSVRRGDTTTWTFEVSDDTDPSGLRDLTGDFLRFTVKRHKSDADTAALLRLSSTTSGIAKLNQTTNRGQFTVTVLHADTDAWDVDLVGYYDVQITLADGSVVTPFSGTFSAWGDVTINSGAIAGDV